jgi:flagellar hook-associated protein 1 FlgK
MTSLIGALSIALSGLQTASGQIAVASNNISNANTPGYHNKTANLSSIELGADGGGVTIESYSRATDSALTQNYNASTSTASYYGSMNTYLTQLQSILNSSAGNPALTNDLSNFQSAWNQYASDPSNAVQQQSLVSAGTTLANDINTIASNVGSLDTQVQSDTTTTVATMNSDIKQIAALNGQISVATSSGQDTSDLQDQRDTLVNNLSSYVSIAPQNRANGAIAIYSTSGQLLVDGVVPSSFTYDGTNIKDDSGATVNGSLTGGKLQAELDFRDTTQANSTSPGVGTIPKIQSQLAVLVGAFVNPTNGSTSAFANAYASAATASTANGATQNGQTVDSSFFTCNFTNGQPDTSSFAVNPDLLDGTSEIPQTNVQSISSTFSQTNNYTYPQYGLTAVNVTYAQLGSQILSGFQQSANTISSESSTYSSEQSYYQTTLASETGVNLDNELANLVVYQNSYAACAHVITTVNTMLNALQAVIP